MTGMFSATPRLAGVRVVNPGDNPHRYDIKLRRDGDIVFEGTRELTSEGDNSLWSWWITEGNGAKYTAYTATLRVDDGPWLAWEELRPGPLRGDEDIDCVELNIDAKPGYANSYFPEHPCPDESSKSTTHSSEASIPHRPV
ncbi:MAG: hypothetical protein ABEJ08_00395 [Halobacteriaceae archaeon]